MCTALWAISAVNVMVEEEESYHLSVVKYMLYNTLKYYIASNAMGNSYRVK